MPGILLPPEPSLPTFSAAPLGFISQSDLNALPAHVLALYNQTQGGWRVGKPMCLVRALATYQALSGVDSYLTWDSSAQDTDGMYNANTPTQLTVNTTGWYRLVLQVHWDSTVGGRRACKILVNGLDVYANPVGTDARDLGTANEGTLTSCEAFAHLVTGSTIYGSVWHSAGHTLSLVNTYSGTFLSAEWLCP